MGQEFQIKHSGNALSHPSWMELTLWLDLDSYEGTFTSVSGSCCQPPAGVVLLTRIPTSGLDLLTSGDLKEAGLLTWYLRAPKVSVPVDKAEAVSTFLCEPQKSHSLHSTTFC